MGHFYKDTFYLVYRVNSTEIQVFERLSMAIDCFISPRYTYFLVMKLWTNILFSTHNHDNPTCLNNHSEWLEQVLSFYLNIIWFGFFWLFPCKNILNTASSQNIPVFPCVMKIRKQKIEPWTNKVSERELEEGDRLVCDL